MAHALLTFFQIFLYYPLLNVLTFIIAIVPGHNAAWGIIGLTLIVRFLLLIPSKRAAQSQRKLSELTPLMEELKAEYGSDKQGLSVAQMDLYKQNGINPFASCLPILIQLPLLIVLYQAVLHGLTPGQAHIYPFVPKPEFIQTHFLGLNLLNKDKTFILPILVGILQFLQLKMVTPPAPPKAAGQAPDATQMMQKQSMFILPFVIFFSALRLPAGAGIYWLVGSMFTIIQQYFVNKENLRLKGVDKALVTGDKIHPENHQKFEQVKEVIEKSEKKGVNVTVRRKK